MNSAVASERAPSWCWYGVGMTLTGVAIFLVLGVVAFLLINKLKDQ